MILRLTPTILQTGKIGDQEGTMISEDKLRRDVEDELKWEPGIDHRQIGVAIRDAVVTLVGETHSLSEKCMAEQAVERVAGVKGVANEITVSVLHEPTDDDICSAVGATMAWNACVPSDQVKVKVEKGWITLTGEVDYDYQRRACEEAVRSLRGIRGVTSLTSVKPRSPRRDIVTEIEKALSREGLHEARKITVDVANGTVTLRGSVCSCAQRNEAERTAFRSPGVTSVDNLLVVADPREDDEKVRA